MSPEGERALPSSRWSVGRTLDTPQTRKWPQGVRDDNDAHEARRLFANFTEDDLGRSRQLIAEFHGPDAAKNCAYVARLHNKSLTPDPATARVLEAAKAWKSKALREGPYGRLSAEAREVVDAVEALAGREG